MISRYKAMVYEDGYKQSFEVQSVSYDILSNPVEVVLYDGMGELIKYDLEKNDNVELLRYTGVFDVNGRELYETVCVSIVDQAKKTYGDVHYCVEWDKNNSAFVLVKLNDDDSSDYSSVWNLNKASKYVQIVEIDLSRYDWSELDEEDD